MVQVQALFSLPSAPRWFLVAWGRNEMQTGGGGAQGGGMDER